MSLEDADKLIDLIGRVNTLDIDKASKEEIIRYLRWALRKCVKAYWRGIEDTAG